MTRVPGHRGSLVGPSVEVLRSSNGRQCREMRGRATKIPNSRRCTSCIIPKPEAVGNSAWTPGGAGSSSTMPDVMRDDKAVACRMDRAGRLWVAISRRSERCLAGVRGRTSKLVLFMYTSIWEPRRTRYLARVLGQWGSPLGRSVKVMGGSYDICLKRNQGQQPNQCGL